MRYTHALHPYLLALVLCVVAMPGVARAQADTGKFMFTVTPPLLQVALSPGETWSTTIQVVNQNAYEVRMYAQPVLFTPGGETGRPVFVQTIPGTGEPIAHDSSVIAGWITVPDDAMRIPPEQTYTLPVTLRVPADASPGGHYAAILIGNTPSGPTGENTISVSSAIASLIFVRVAGDVVEQGQIREFSTRRLVYERPEAVLQLRFENKGNVHLQPRGAITIYNMFGKVRGTVEVNAGAGYGNVLPGSIREFTFSWEADTGVWDIGQYRAVATLGYGEESKAFVSATQYFWVLPIIPFLEVFGAVLVLGYLLVAGVRAYVRRALALEVRAQANVVHDEPDVAPIHAEPRLSARVLARPLAEGLVDLRMHREVVATAPLPAQGRSRTLRIVLALATIIAIAVSGILVQRYVRDVTTAEHTYTVEELRDEVQP